MLQTMKIQSIYSQKCFTEIFNLNFDKRKKKIQH